MPGGDDRQLRPGGGVPRAIDGDRLVFESLEGATARLRFTWDATDPGVITWRNGMAVGDGSWLLIEEYRMVPR